MQVSKRVSDGFILQHGGSLGELEGAVIEELSPSEEQQLLSMYPDNLATAFAGVIMGADRSFTLVPPPPPSPPPPPPPNIQDLIAALAASPSIDQPTKDKLTQALEGS